MIEFNWIDAINAHPDGMTVLFFPADEESRFWRFDISDKEGGEIEILPGIYNVLAFNNDLSGIEFFNTKDYDQFSAKARNISDSLTSPTGMLYSAHLKSVKIFNPHSNSNIISLTPDSLSTVYHVCLDSVSGSERIKTAHAIIKGLARSVCLPIGCNSKDICCMAAPLHIDPNCNTRLEAIGTGFGNPDIPNPQITLEVIVTTSHGKYSKSFDVTHQVMNCKYPKDVYLNIKGLDIPEADNPENPDGNTDVGISVGVDGWQLIEIFYS